MIVPWDDNTDTSVKTVIGIDPDVEKNGYASLDIDTREMLIETLPFPDLLDSLRMEQRRAEVMCRRLMVVIEAGWLNKSNWHLSPKDTKAIAAAKGNHTGRNHETGRKIAEMCAHWQIPYELMKPLSLKVGGVHLWKGKDGKITQEELCAITGYKWRTNQEGRDAALLAWVWAGLPVKLQKKRAF